MRSSLHARIVTPERALPLRAFGLDLRVLLTTEATGGTISVLTAEHEPGEGPPDHVHHSQDELFFILEGLYELTVDGRTTTAGPGTIVFIPRNVVHRFKNVGDTRARMLDWSLPGGQDHYFKAISELATGDGFTDEKALEISRKFDTYFPALDRGAGPMAARNLDPATLDVVSPEYYQRNGYPHPEWTWLRHHAPVFWYERPNVEPFWAITKHADIIEISKQPDIFLNAPRDTQHLGDHCDRDPRRHLLHEITRCRLGRRVEHVAGQARHLLVQAADRPWREPAARESPVAGVIRRIHSQHVAQFTFGERAELPREDGEPRPVQEHLRLLADLDDIGVLGDGPERLHVRPVIPEDRRMAA